MSECVVRMKMPNGCHDCKLMNMVGNCPIPMFDGEDEKKLWTLEECFQRPPWCPIVCALPNGHGDLIDKQSFIKRLYMYCGFVKQILPSEVFEFYLQILKDVEGEVNKETVIVPAERSEHV